MFWAARKLSRHGMWKPLVVCVATSTQPSRYIGAHEVLCQSPSIDASFSGWLWVTSTAMFAPKMSMLLTANTTKNGNASLMLDWARSTCRFLIRYQALTLSISAEPAVHAATHTWSRRGMNEGVKTIDQKSVITARAGAGTCWIV